MGEKDHCNFFGCRSGSGCPHNKPNNVVNLVLTRTVHIASLLNRRLVLIIGSLSKYDDDHNDDFKKQ